MINVTPEQEAHVNIDRLLEQAGWSVQNADSINLYAGNGVAVREFPLRSGHGKADYLLYVNQKAAGVVEAKPEGSTLTGVEVQSEKYSTGLPDNLPAHHNRLPFLYESSGAETQFTNRLDPEPRSRLVFSFHSPKTFTSWLDAPEAPSTSGHLIAEEKGSYLAGDNLRQGLKAMPPLNVSGLWPVQERAIKKLEESLAAGRPRALVQMATGSGKTFMACNQVYRLIKHAGARRVLFLVDRSNLGRQTLREFQGFTTPDEGRKFTELYNVQLLQSSHIDPVSKVCIATIQRVYSLLRGEDLDPELEELSGFDAASLRREPVPIEYNPDVPIETFDVIITDECHRSIYNLWRQVLEYFDAFLIGLTATPSKQTFGFFQQNLVMEYDHKQAVVDGVNVDFDTYRIRTAITEQGATVDAGYYIDRRDRLTRKVRWEQLKEDLTYAPNQLDRDVVAEDQIRTVVQTFRDKLFTEIFPSRKDVPKTIIFAKDDSHADDIVRIVRQVFDKGNDFCQKITYKTTGVKPEDLLTSFLASRLARLDRHLAPRDREAIEEASQGVPLQALVSGLVEATDPDAALDAAQQSTGQEDPPESAVAEARRQLLEEAARPFASNPDLRQRLVDIHRSYEQTIDTVSADSLIEAGFSDEQAKAIVQSFQEYIEDHKDEITALQVLYERPYRQRLSYSDLKALADALVSPPRSWTTERLWEAYRQLDSSKVRASGQRTLADIVSVVRYAIGGADELAPFAAGVGERFQGWLAMQEAAGRAFTEEQVRWLEAIRDHIVGSVSMEMSDFQYAPFNRQGGLGKAYELFGDELSGLLEEMNIALVG